MQDDLLQYSCKSPTGGHTETNTTVLFHGTERVSGDGRRTALGRGDTRILEMLLLRIINAIATPNTSHKIRKQ